MTENLNQQEQGGFSDFIARHAKLLTILSVAAGACSGPLSALTEAPSVAIGFWRLTIALPFFWIPILFQQNQREKLFAVSRRDLALCALSGAFLFGHFFTWFNAAKLTNIASAAVLASFHPIVVLLITLFVMKRRVGWKSIAAILIALAGGAMVTGIDYSALDGEHLSGNLLALAAGIFMGLYFAVGDFARKRVPGNIYVLLVFFTCWICFCFAAAGTGTQLLGYGLKDYFCIIAMAILCQIGAHAMFNLCIGHVSSLYVSAWESGEPVFSILLALILLGQVPKGYEVVGCVVVVGALLYYNYQESKANELQS